MMPAQANQSLIYGFQVLQEVIAADPRVLRAMEADAAAPQ